MRNAHCGTVARISVNPHQIGDEKREGKSVLRRLAHKKKGGKAELDCVLRFLDDGLST
jgi:hypothetical protein